MGIRIRKTAKYLPKRMVPNSEFETFLDTSDQWISERTGIKKRHFSSKEEDTSHIALMACEALGLTDEEKEKIDAIFVATFTPDIVAPSIAASLQAPLGLKEELFAIDFNMGCSGYVAGLHLAEAFLKNKRMALVLGAEVISKVLDMQDRTTAVIFADGAGVTLVEKNENPIYFDEGTRSNLKDIYVPGIQVDMPLGKLSMQGKNVFRFASRTLPDSMERTLKKAGIRGEDVAHIVCHQANRRIIDHVAKKAGLPISRFFMNIDRMGNTSSASIPIALDDMAKNNLIKPGEWVMLMGFGAGFSWVTALFKW